MGWLNVPSKLFDSRHWITGLISTKFNLRALLALLMELAVRLITDRSKPIVLHSISISF